VPDFLNHVPKRANTEYGNGQNPQHVSFSPNYENPDLRRALKNFVAALGARYDGDARIGFIKSVQVIGNTCGEWN
jgi:hypothetical protein